MIDALRMAEITTEVMGLEIKKEDIVVASTGVIGVPMPMEKVGGNMVSGHIDEPGRGAII